MSKANIPIDGQGQTVQTVPDRPALAVTYDATISSATSLTLNTGSSAFEVTAIDKAILMRYAASVSTSAFDAVIPANTSKIFFKPEGVTVVSFIEETATAKLVVIEY
ncbi:MAG: hypothetical protein NUV73_00140 [Candidatus Daviesbacteria bacterium]|nr:hypothetical protein [Candidatus Daviesbacteria bacterium]